jgi:predicted methyltransferase
MNDLTRRGLLGLPLLALPLAACTSTLVVADADVDGARLRAALAGAQRSAANRARNAARHPYETLRFFRLRPGQTVVEIAPGGGWYTEVLAPYLREDGRLYAAHEPADAPDEYARRARQRFVEKLAKEPAVYDRVVVGELPATGNRLGGIVPPGGADLTFRNIHNWIEAGRLDAVLQSFNAVLKPGGVLGVEEHRAPPGTSLERVIATGYVPEAFVIERAVAAGFDLLDRSEVNANPLDTHDHPNGVWSLLRASPI